MICKRIRWVASVYGRYLPELREVAEPILREWTEVEEWTDGSRMGNRAAAATRTTAEYLGMVATLADAEALGVSLAWERCDVVALDSKGVI